jgi:hypothetical protein
MLKANVLQVNDTVGLAPLAVLRGMPTGTSARLSLAGC